MATKTADLPDLKLSPHTAAQYQSAVDAAAAAGKVATAMEILRTHTDPAVRVAFKIIDEHVISIWDRQVKSVTLRPIEEPDVYTLALSGADMITIGVNEGCDVQVHGGTGASSIHLTIDQRDGQWVAVSPKDRWTLNGKRVAPRGEEPLSFGDTIGIGWNRILLVDGS